MSLRKSLVLVVGAGASHEAGLPVGAVLKGRIADLLASVGDDPGKGGPSDDSIRSAIRDRLARDGKYPDIAASARYASAAALIKRTMPLASSIDQFLDAHRENAELEICGKMAVIRSILDAERGSLLFINGDDELDLGKIEGTWFAGLFRILFNGVQAESIGDRLDRLGIVCFNYDRCIEHFLYCALRLYYGISEADAAAALERLHIIHPYGTVGELPWQRVKSHAVPFGGAPSSAQLCDLVPQIKTFTEQQNARTDEISTSRSIIKAARTIAFLGFAFHEQNMRLLLPDVLDASSKPEPTIYGTVFQISGADQVAIRQDLLAFGGFQPSRLQLINTNCVDFMRDYERSLATAW